ncbi:enoyl-CoA hydratase/isomerase family protein [Sorangium sp. So ce117]|uniref:enoyl-CoA hydratase/isomerase family protein n=1 Tax=Sorangium sp. So ce117 TaxID=3133277 RepID=UPI003F628888
MAEITPNRPKVNAMNQALLREMTDVFGRLAQDDAVSGVLVRGTGQRLSAGLDLHELASLDRERLSSFLDDFDAAFGAAFRLPKPRRPGCWRVRRPRPSEATDRSRRAPQARGLTLGPGLGQCLRRGCDPSSRSPQIPGEATVHDGSPPRNRPASETGR